MVSKRHPDTAMDDIFSINLEVGESNLVTNCNKFVVFYKMLEVLNY